MGATINIHSHFEIKWPGRVKTARGMRGLVNGQRSREPKAAPDWTGGLQDLILQDRLCSLVCFLISPNPKAARDLDFIAFS
jgi:hypothetical protein